MAPALYLIPSLLGEIPVEQVLPQYNRDLIIGIRHFIVEDVRTARRFLKQVEGSIDIEQLTFYTLNKHTKPDELAGMLVPLEQGEPMGVISEAGCPAVADPGSDVVAIAQRKGLRVVPLVGPSSIILALMGSGFNGQSFAFNGYLPIEQEERIKALKKLEWKVYNEDQTQIFMETPYRNGKMKADTLKACKPQTRLCIASGLTTPDEYIRTLTIKQWKEQIPELGKVPSIFLIYK
ncbi:MAG TPA: SAM-dependent methyltransferase [Bacteroidaceae bacterium]|nr:SAM-dependent methyltransferase [Bacteroidaceae bacterium]HPB04058.1 SAM-dependent methyltransferase [Bacteroidaceae bacterium]HQL25987.1 SAM-dependent methyltransferase [Bacteroidaceae bacterium]